MAKNWEKLEDTLVKKSEANSEEGFAYELPFSRHFSTAKLVVPVRVQTEGACLGSTLGVLL